MSEHNHTCKTNPLYALALAAIGFFIGMSYEKGSLLIWIDEEDDGGGTT